MDQNNPKLIYWGTKIGVTWEGKRRVMYTKDRGFADVLFNSLILDSQFSDVTKQAFHKPEKK